MSTEIQRPLVVDLDGTLIYTDLLIESFLGLIKKNPLRIISVFFWLLQGKVTLKRGIAELVTIDVTVLPYNQEVLAYIKAEKAKGRKLVLATASVEKYANQVGEYIGLFDEILATTATTNLSGSNKRAKLVELYGDKGFDYIGNATPDIDVWKGAQNAIVVSSSDELESKASSVATVSHRIRVETPGIKTYVKALRLHQWLKNCLILVPLLTAHKFLEPMLVLQAIGAFFAFGFCASSVYLVNDLLDLEDDRHHKTKCKRPFASGAIPILNGIILTPVLLLLSLLIGLLLPSNFLVVLAVYYVVTTAYSFSLKKKVLIDVIVLATLYTIRIIAGAATIGVMPSFWLLAFSLFIFHSLALVKRCTELYGLKEEAEKTGRATQVRGRGYTVSDIGLLYTMGTTSGFMSVLVLALYVNSENVKQLYVTPEVIWLLCPIMLYWISRVWILTDRGNMNDDPIVFALKDRTSLITVVCMGLVVLAAM